MAATEQPTPNGDSMAQEKLSAGRRSLACDEYPQAVESLTVACQLLAEKFGEESDELAEPYFYYGKSLLELARMENGVLGNALDGVAAEEENEADLSESDQFERVNGLPEDERDEVRNKVYSAMSAEEKEKSKATDAEADKAVAVDVTDQQKEKDTAEPSNDDATKSGTEDNTVSELPATEKSDDAATTEMSEDVATAEKSEDIVTTEKSDDLETTEKSDDLETTEETSEETAADEEMATDDGEEEDTAEEDNAEDDVEAGTSSQEDADDIPNLQLAWEVLELSKKIYLRITGGSDVADKAIREKLGEVYRTLGEVSLETSAYDQAIQDLSSCLEIQNECFESDNRFLAETHYQLGNCYLLNRDYSKAMEDLRKAKSVLELRISNFDNKLTEELSEQEKESCQKELQELRQILPDIMAKIEDADDECHNAEKAEAEIKAVISSQKDSGTTTIGFGDSSTSTGASTIATKKANDISNLIRKRKTDDQETEEDTKKAKTDSTTDGDKENGISPVIDTAEIKTA